MPHDITMCPGEGCPIRARCYRFRALPAARQDWFGAAPYDPRAGTCDEFWDLAERAPTPAQVRERAYHLWLAEGCPEGRADVHWRKAREELTASFLGELSDEG